jgi:predicted NUDIX family NTP pyrophosphohydrolase
VTSQPSAGLLLYRRAPAGWQVFLAHPGGPFWQAKDLGA